MKKPLVKAAVPPEIVEAAEGIAARLHAGDRDEGGRRSCGAVVHGVCEAPPHYSRGGGLLKLLQQALHELCGSVVRDA